MFKKGQSGNPGGRPKGVAEVKTLAQQHTEAAIKALAEITTNKKAPASARAAAAGTLLDRGWGRAPQHVTIEKTPLDDLDAATLAALAQALSGAEEVVAGGDGGETRH